MMASMLRRTLITSFLLASLPALPAHAGEPAVRVAHAPAPITLVFRFDDISAHSNLHLEEQVLGAFAMRRMPLTLAVIPMLASGSVYDPGAQAGDPLPEAKIRLLRKAIETGLFEAALHGYAHQTLRGRLASILTGFGGTYSEFAGAEDLEQRRKIERGRVLLETQLGTSVSTFVPPWNSYDEGTLSALEKAGFRTLSADRRGPSPEKSRLRYLPRTCGLAEVRAGIYAARRSRADDPVIVALFHPSDFAHDGAKGGDFSLARLGSLLDWVGGQDDVRVLTLDEAARVLPDLGARRFLANRSAPLWRLIPAWPGRFPAWPSREIYRSTAAARRERGALDGLALGVFCGALLAAALAFGAARRIYARLRLRPVIYFGGHRRSRGSCARLPHGMD